MQNYADFLIPPIAPPTTVAMRWRQELGAQIKQARKSARLTQEQLAAELGKSRQMISRYETGGDAPAVDVLAGLAQILDTEFYIQGWRVRFDQLTHPRTPCSLPKQLHLKFEKCRRFHDAVVEITPRKGRILIRAEIPA